MTIAILDQNGIKDLERANNIDTFIVSPMLFWELYNNVDNSLGPILVDYLQIIADRIRVTFKSITCEKIELDSRTKKELDTFIDQDNTKLIHEWLNTPNRQISDIKNQLSLGFTKEDFNNKFTDLASNGWLPKLNEQFKKFNTSNERVEFRSQFERIDDSVTENLFNTTIGVCFKLLSEMGFNTEQSVLFVKKTPSVFYNRVFCHTAILRYRSTQASFNERTLPNDSKDIDYLFCTHLVDQIFGADKFMNNIFLHLKKSYQILENTETGLD